jgi:hypothetical protein
MQPIQLGPPGAKRRPNPAALPPKAAQSSLAPGYGDR